MVSYQQFPAMGSDRLAREISLHYTRNRSLHTKRRSFQMVISNGSAKKRGRPWGSKKEKDNPLHPMGGGGAPAQKGNAHGVEEIVYDGSCNTNHHTKDRRHEQKEAYHKTRSGATPKRKA